MSLDKKRYMELEFDSETTMEDVLTELIHFKRLGIVAMTKINDIEIYNTSENLEMELDRAFKNLDVEDYLKLKELENELVDEYRILENLHYIENDTLFKYYFGLMRKFVLPERLEIFEHEMFSNYRFYTEHYAILRLASSFMHIMNYANTNRYADINNLLRIFDDGENIEFLDIALDLVRKYAGGGGLIDVIMRTKLDGDVKEEVEETIKIKEKKINELLNKKVQDTE